jgi:hypothetical protein
MACAVNKEKLDPFGLDLKLQGIKLQGLDALANIRVKRYIFREDEIILQ